MSQINRVYSRNVCLWARTLRGEQFARRYNFMSQVPSSYNIMAPQFEQGAPIQWQPQRSEEALSGRTICETEQSLERQPPPEYVDDEMPQPPKGSFIAPEMSQDPAKAEFPKSQKLSVLATSTFVLACVTVPCCIAFIGFLWSNPNDTQNRGTWLKIVLNGWILKSITISTMVLLVAASAQAG